MRENMSPMFRVGRRDSICCYLRYMKVSKKSGAQIWTLIYHDPHYGDSQLKGAPDFTKTSRDHPGPLAGCMAKRSPSRYRSKAGALGGSKK